MFSEMLVNSRQRIEVGNVYDTFSPSDGWFYNPAVTSAVSVDPLTALVRIWCQQMYTCVCSRTQLVMVSGRLG